MSLNTLNIISIHSEAGYPTGDEVPCAEAEASITIGRLLRKAKDGPCSSCYTIVPCSGAFKQVTAEAKASVGVADI